MKDMFYGCSSLTNTNLSNFNTSNVTNMEGMFLGCSEQFQNKIKAKYKNIKEEAFYENDDKKAFYKNFDKEECYFFYEIDNEVE